MSKIEPWKAWVFVGTLVMIATMIHGCRLSLDRATQPQVVYSYRAPEVRAPAPVAPQPQPNRPAPVTTAPPRDDRPTPSRTAVRDFEPAPERFVPAPAPYRVEPPPPPKPREKTPEELAAEHRQFVERYVDTGITRKPGIKTVALAVVSEDGKLNRPVSEALARRFNAGGVELLGSFFKPAFGTEGLLASVLSGSTQVLEQLDLAKTLDGLLLAQETVEYETNPDLENVISAHLHLQVTALPLAGAGQNETWTFTANGTGFRNRDARAMAEERLCKQLATDTKMTLESIPIIPPK